MTTPKNESIFGLGACEDVLAISSESDRPCLDTPEVDNKAEKKASAKKKAEPEAASKKQHDVLE